MFSDHFTGRLADLLRVVRIVDYAATRIGADLVLIDDLFQGGAVAKEASENGGLFCALDFQH